MMRGATCGVKSVYAVRTLDQFIYLFLSEVEMPSWVAERPSSILGFFFSPVIGRSRSLRIPRVLVFLFFALFTNLLTNGQKRDDEIYESKKPPTAKHPPIAITGCYLECRIHTNMPARFFALTNCIFESDIWGWIADGAISKQKSRPRHYKHSWTSFGYSRWCTSRSSCWWHLFQRRWFFRWFYESIIVETYPHFFILS